MAKLKPSATPPKGSNIFVVRRAADDSPKLWCARYVPPFDKELGYQPPMRAFYGKTWPEAEAERKKGLAEKPTLDKKTRLIDYITSAFDQAKERRTRVGQKRLQWSTYSNQKARLANYLCDPLKEDIRKCALFTAALGTVTQKAVTAYFDLLLDLGVSREIRAQLRIDLGQVFDQAEEYMTGEDPRRLLLKKVEIESALEPNRQFLDQDEVEAAIHDETKPLQARLILAFQFSVMCRPSEMWALTWADFTADFSEASFTKATRRGKDGVAVRPGTKNYVNRTIPMWGLVSALLRELRKARMAAGVTSEYVFLAVEAPVALAMTNDRFQHRWPAMRTALGLTGTAGLYSAKHLGNTWLHDQGVAPEDRAKRMGHKDERMAVRTYRNHTTAQAKRTANTFDGLGTPQKVAQ